MKWIVKFVCNQYTELYNNFSDTNNDIHLPPSMTFCDESELIEYVEVCTNLFKQYDIKIIRYE